MKQARKEVETQAQKMLEQGMETQVNINPFMEKLHFAYANNTHVHQSVPPIQLLI